MIKYKRKLNIITGAPPEPIRLGQYDDDVMIEFDLYTSEGILTIEPDTTVAIRGIKPDGNGISVEGVLKSSQDKYTHEETYTACFDVTKQMTACAGECRYKLVLTKDGKELNTGSFQVIVDRAPLDKDSLPSESEIREIVETLDRTEDLLKASRSITKVKKEIEKNVTAVQEAKEITVDALKSVKDLKAEIIALKDDIQEQSAGVDKKIEKMNHARAGILEEIEAAGASAAGNLDAIQQTTMEQIHFRLSQAEKEKYSAADTLRKITDTLDALQKSIDDLTQAHKDMKARVEHMEFEMFKTGGEEA